MSNKASIESFKIRDPRLKSLMRKMVLAHEGFRISHSYINTPINTRLRDESSALMMCYWRIFRDNLDELFAISQGMELTARKSGEGK
ncbi:MAG: hypothetical protein HYX61_12625 [Gammaproteobacteria bacterium]|jgi:hypothetical protein|nr:hypothetical protein [Gammaproteobacteria bacterium]